MPEYLSPGVYIEETSFRSKSIEGVSTSTAAIIGPARSGPVLLEPDLITSLGDFERIYGEGQKLSFAGDVTRENYLWHGARAFFTEGGRRLYVSRIFVCADGEDRLAYAGLNDTLGESQLGFVDGHARATFIQRSPADPSTSMRFLARYPGSGGNATVRLRMRVGKNVLSAVGGANSVRGLTAGDVVLLILDRAADPVNSPIDHPVYRVEQDDDGNVSFSAGGTTHTLTSLGNAAVYPLLVSVGVTSPGASEEVWEGLALDPDHTRAGAEDSLSARFRYDPERPSLNRELPIVVETGSDVDGVAIAGAILAGALRVESALLGIRSRRALRDDDYVAAIEQYGAVEFKLEGGNDGGLPSPDVYDGDADPASSVKSGLKQLEDIDDISIVAAPGSSYGTDTTQALAVAGLLIAHAERMRYRIAVLDSMNAQSVSAVRDYKAKLDSKHAALYYPWIRVLDPITRLPTMLPPSGFVSGIYARNDVERAVYKAPANEVVRLALGFEHTLNSAQQDVLNPEGINCFRSFEGRGHRLWGARTISSDPEWKYVNLRRYFAYLERSIDRGTQWAVFEPNGERLWGNVRRTIEDFLANEYQNGALLGERQERAFFVRCDRSTMTQNDLDNGRLVCLIGVAPLKPAEFVIFRIGQWTGDRRV
jgi:phage tail sheath protein FI